MSLTLFVNAYEAVFAESVTDPADANWKDEFDQEERYSVTKKKGDTFTLNEGESRTITIPGGIALTDWFFLILRVVGTGTLDTVGKDAAAASITSSLGVYGTSVLPGILLLSTYNLVSITVTSLADNSVFELLNCTCVED